MTPRWPSVAVVTGASGGVGRATARRLAAGGADVGLLARGIDGLAGAARDVELAGRRAVAVPTDVADAEAVARAAALVEDELGPIDVWVNNAMVTVFAPVDEITPAEFARATSVTYLGQVHGTLEALHRMLPRDRGHIVNVGSALAFRGIALQAPYCGAKFAVRGFTQSVRTELLHRRSGVRISMVELPAMNTTQFGWCRAKVNRHPQPVPPIYEPEVAADAIVAVARDGRRGTNVGSWNWLLVQANKVMPGVLDHYAAATTADAQLGRLPITADRPDNLYEPADGSGGGDWSAHGGFGDRSRGVLDPHFLRSLPQTMSAFGRALLERAREVASHPPNGSVADEPSLLHAAAPGRPHDAVSQAG